jgi:hypothetical protein
MSTSGDEPALGGQHGDLAASVRLGGERAILHLVEIIERDNRTGRASSEDQRYALEKLAEIGSKQALDCLIDFIPQAFMLTPRVIQALSQFDDKRALHAVLSVEYDALEFPENILAKRAVTIALKQWVDKPSAIERLFVLLADDDQHILDEAAKSLATSTNPEVSQRLIDCVVSDDLPISAAASNALALMKSPETVPPLIEALKHTSLRVRQSASYCLGAIGDHRAADALFYVAQRDEDCREVAVTSLGRLGDERAVEPLTSYLKQIENDPQMLPHARAHAVYYADLIAGIEGKLALQALLDILDEVQHQDVIEAVHLALSRFNDVRIIPVFANAVGDLSTSMQQFALAALCSPVFTESTVALGNSLGISEWGDGVIIAALRRNATPEALAAVAAWEASQHGE